MELQGEKGGGGETPPSPGLLIKSSISRFSLKTAGVEKKIAAAPYGKWDYKRFNTITSILRIDYNCTIDIIEICLYGKSVPLRGRQQR